MQPLSQRQIEACRRNWKKRGPITPAGRERLRQAAERNRPWEHSTGPRTAEGKASSRTNAIVTGRHAETIEPFASIAHKEWAPYTWYMAAYRHALARQGLPEPETPKDAWRIANEFLGADVSDERELPVRCRFALQMLSIIAARNHAEVRLFLAIYDEEMRRLKARIAARERAQFVSTTGDAGNGKRSVQTQPG